MKCLNTMAMACLAAVLLFAVSGCDDKPALPGSDIISQKVTPPGRITITVLVKYGFSLHGFEKTVEAKFPELDLVQIGNYTRGMGIGEYEKRLSRGDIPDMVMTWPLDVGEQYWQDCLLDLSGMGFTSRYQLGALNSIARNGKLYYLPGPAQVRGIIYNKTLFEEKGWKVPKDFEGFIELCKAIEATGMRALQLGFANAEVMESAFIGFNYASSFSKPRDRQWLAGYNKGQGSFGDQFGPALDVFQRMTREGIWKPEDLGVGYAERERMLFTRQCAMVEDSVLTARMGHSLTGSTDQFALMPFFNPGTEADWARLFMVCYIGLSKDLALPENKEKYKLVHRLMDYISTQEGQYALAADNGAMFSSVAGVPPPDVPEIQDIVPALNRGRYAVFPQLGHTGKALHLGLAAMIRSGASKETVIAMVDQANALPAAGDASISLGTATADFSLLETGNFVTDAMRAWSECDVALFLDNGKDGSYNSKGISAKLYAGEITTADLERILPDLKMGEAGVLHIFTMSGEELLSTLEYAIHVNNAAKGWFYYFSGLRMEYDPAARPGARIRRISTADGKPINLEKIYSIAAMDDSLPESLAHTVENSNVKIINILARAIEKAGSISPANDGRFILP